MPIKLQSFYPVARPDLPVPAEPDSEWKEQLTTAAATTLAVLVVATVAVLLGMT